MGQKSHSDLKPRQPHLWVVSSLSWFVFVSGVWALLESLMQQMPSRLDRLDRVLLNTPERLSAHLATLAGLGMIYLSFQLRSGKRIAWGLAIAMNLVLLQHVLRHPLHHWLSSSLALVSLVCLLLANQEFAVRSDRANIRQGLKLAGIILLVALLYGVVGFEILEARNFGLSFGPWSSLVHTIRQYLLLGNPDLHAKTRYARLFLDSLNVMGAGSLVLVVLALFRPVRFAIGPLPYELERARRIAARYSRNPEDFFKFWPISHKHYFFGSCREAFLVFGIFNGVALVVHDPTGSEDEFDRLIESFLTYAHTNGWSVSFVHCSEEYRQLYESHGLEMLGIGQEAYIDVQLFAQETATDKHFRYILNKFSKLGYTTELLSASAAADVLDQLQQISTAWLQSAKRKELHFLLGHFNRDYLAKCDIFVVRDENGRIVAFTNLLPKMTEGVVSVDLLRYRADAPPSIMHFLYRQLILELAEQGAVTFNLGLAPLAGIEESKMSTLPGAVLKLAKQLSGGIFSFEGLEQFKRKFRPDWQGRFIAYENGTPGLARSALALLRAVTGR